MHTCIYPFGTMLCAIPTIRPRHTRRPRVTRKRTYGATNGNLSHSKRAAVMIPVMSAGCKLQCLIYHFGNMHRALMPMSLTS